LGFGTAEEMNNPANVESYRKNKNDVYAQEKGYKDWEDLLSKSKWMKKTDSKEEKN
jgi:hypothetical protein